MLTLFQSIEDLRQEIDYQMDLIINERREIESILAYNLQSI